MSDPLYNAVPPGGYALDGDEWFCPECGEIAKDERCRYCGTPKPE